MLCTCLCNKAGHHGICQETADPKCVLAYQAIQLYAPGFLCRSCYEAVVRVMDAAVRSARNGQGEPAHEAVAGAGSGQPQRR